MNYHNITKDDMLNGDGLRVVLWVAGCNHHCKDCQNPITWDPNGGLPFGTNEELEIFRELEKSYISGITFSGGDPLHTNNRYEIIDLTEKIKKKFPEKTIWLYTGYTYEEIISRNALRFCIKNIDVLVDGIFDVNKKDTTCHWVGSTNQRVIDVRASLKENSIILHEK